MLIVKSKKDLKREKKNYSFLLWMLSKKNSLNRYNKKK